MKITPGPWRVDESVPDQIITDTGAPPNQELLICTVEKLGIAMDEEEEANAQAIAALPELVEALKYAISHLSDGRARDNIVAGKLAEVLRKAIQNGGSK